MHLRRQKFQFQGVKTTTQRSLLLTLRSWPNPFLCPPALGSQHLAFKKTPGANTSGSLSKCLKRQDFNLQIERRWSTLPNEIRTRVRDVFSFWLWPLFVLQSFFSHRATFPFELVSGGAPSLQPELSVSSEPPVELCNIMRAAKRGMSLATWKFTPVTQLHN